MNYFVDFLLQIERLLPTELRKPKMRQWLSALIRPISYNHELMVTFVEGSLDTAFWDASLVIAPGQRVRRHGKLYENISGVNQNGPDPITSSAYKEILSDWRGVKRLVRYNSQLIILEFALNEWFNLEFKQPDYTQDPDVYHSDIFIVRNGPRENYFVVYEDTAKSSAVFEVNADIEDAVYENASVSTANQWDFKIMYPLSQISGTTLSPDARFKELRALVYQYKVYGTRVIFEGY